MRKYSTINNELRIIYGLTPNEYAVALCIMDGINGNDICYELNMTQHQANQAIKKLIRKSLVIYSEAKLLKITALFYEGHGSN